MSITGESVREITGFAENDTITLKARLFDIPGNETVGNESSTKLLIDQTPPSLVNVSYESDFSDSSSICIRCEIFYVELRLPMVDLMIYTC